MEGIHSVDQEARVFAYDVKHDATRFKELERKHGRDEARRLQAQELVDDLASHLGELSYENRITAYSFRYLLNEHGELVEDSVAQKPIREMFANQADVVADLWLEKMIPYLEQVGVGGAALTISPRKADSQEGHEAYYDYAYGFIKVSHNEVHAIGIELDLSPEEQAVILNHQYEIRGEYLSLLTNNPDWEEVRSRVIYVDPEIYGDLDELMLEVVGRPLARVRNENRYTSKTYFEDLHRLGKEELERRRRIAVPLAHTILDQIAQGTSQEYIQKWLSVQQTEILNRENPTLTEMVLNSGGLLRLGCGLVQLSRGFELGFSAGDGLLMVESSSYVGEWHSGNCRSCGAKGIEVGDCEVCRHCQWEFDMGLRS